MKLRLKSCVTLVLFFVSTCLTAQYVGPVEHTLEFRIYGKNARPVTNKSLAYRTKVEYTAHKNLRSRFRSYYDHKTLNIKISERFLTSYPVKINVKHKGETMLLGSQISLDSVTFRPGCYFVPLDFAPLFRKDLLKNLIVNNKDLSYFESTSPDSAGAVKRLILTKIENAGRESRHSYSKEDKRSLNSLRRELVVTRKYNKMDEYGNEYWIEQRDTIPVFDNTSSISELHFIIRILVFTEQSVALIGEEFLLYSKDGCKTWTFYPYYLQGSSDPGRMHHSWPHYLIEDGKALGSDSLLLYTRDAVYKASLKNL